MIERDFKELLQKIDLSNETKKELNSFSDLIIKTIENEINSNVKLAYLNLDEPFKDSYNLDDERKICLYITLFPKNKSLPYEVLRRANINEVENALIYNLKNNLLFKEKELEIIREEEKDLLIIELSGVTLEVHFRYKKDSLVKVENHLESNTLLYEDYLNQKAFQNEMVKEFPKFKNTVKLIKYFAKSIGFKIESLELIKVILAYSLENYFKNNDYAGYLESFTNGLTDFIDGKVISISDELYKKMKVLSASKGLSKYNVIDSGNRNNNLAENIAEVSMYKKLKSEIITKLPKDGAFIKIDVTPEYVVSGKTIAWKFVIVGSETENYGGEYENTLDNYYMCIYRAMLKGMQFAVKEKLGNNITIICDNLEAFNSEKLSYENESRFANVRTYIKDNDLAITYEKKKGNN